MRYMLCLIYDYREICWFKPVVGLSVRPSTFPSAFLLVSQVDYILYLPTFPSSYLLVFHTSYNLPFDCHLVSQTVYVSMRPSTFPSAFHLVSQAAFYDHLPFPLPFCVGCLYICLPFPYPACLFSDCLLSSVHGIYPSMFACFLYREKA